MQLLKKTIIFGTFLICNIILQLSCKKFVTVPPPQTQVTGSVVYENAATADAAVAGIYSQMISAYPGFASGGITLYAGLSADELANYQASGSQPEFYKNALTAPNIYIETLWSGAYQYIYSANAVMEGLNNSKSVSIPVKNQLIGEALFIRAFCHFYLTALFGDVPYIRGTSYKVNTLAQRDSKLSVLQYIIGDLNNAATLLASDYSYSGGERTRPNKWCAEALLAKTYLYNQKWDSAEIASSTVINNTGTYNLVSDLNTAFLANSSEAILQLQPNNPGLNTSEGNAFILTGRPNSSSLSQNLLDSFEPGDQRRLLWVDSITAGSQTFFYPFKYKVKAATSLSEYYMVFRLAEQYLIRAEARAMQNNITGADLDLNIIRHRAGLPDKQDTDVPSMMDAIIHERQTELFTEWGQRWMDLIRTGRVDAVFGLEKPGWKATDALYPIPYIQIQNDPNCTQNPNY